MVGASSLSPSELGWPWAGGGSGVTGQLSDAALLPHPWDACRLDGAGRWEPLVGVLCAGLWAVWVRCFQGSTSVADFACPFESGGLRSPSP